MRISALIIVAALVGGSASAETMDRGQMVQIQIQLAARGYDPQGVDGLMGPNTAAAIRAFEIDNGLPPSGQPSAALLTRLSSVTAVSAPAVVAAPKPVPGMRMRLIWPVRLGS